MSTVTVDLLQPHPVSANMPRFLLDEQAAVDLFPGSPPHLHYTLGHPEERGDEAKAAEVVLGRNELTNLVCNLI